MKILHAKRDSQGLLQMPPSVGLPQEVAATVGTFDGVHLGHRYLFHQLREFAQKLGLPTMVITFDVPPVSLFHPERSYTLLSDDAEKQQAIASEGIDYMVILPFDKALASLSATDFIGEILHKMLRVKILLSGYDNRFGRKMPEEQPHTMEETCNRLGIIFHRGLPAIDTGGEEYSSSLVRQTLHEGKISKANALLGYPYSLRGTVIHGSKLGRKFGFPTVNILPNTPKKLIPREGVYAALASICSSSSETPLKGMLYVGRRPTVSEGNEKRIEMNLFDFNGDLYGNSITVSFLQFIRGDIHFADTAELVKQLHEDEKNVRNFFK